MKHLKAGGLITSGAGDKKIFPLFEVALQHLCSKLRGLKFTIPLALTLATQFATAAVVPHQQRTRRIFLQDHSFESFDHAL